MTRRPSILPLLLGAVLLLTGCQILPEAQPDPTRFFRLDEPAPSTTAPASDAAVLGLLPIEVPAYLLDARAMAVLDADLQVSYRDFDRWAEPLDEGMSRVLRGALANAPQIQRVLIPPFPLQPERDYDLQIRIVEAAPLRSGSLRFVLRYDLASPDGAKYHSGEYTASGIAWDGTPADLARGLSTALQQAGAAIAAELE
ncbi:PqiC family protein [Actomonas aquatica]|uniref:ABC-type transport auxiliary lipoprotein family protein n=1 Tax=Actomonas aquatica TaxID=2866162 RepID=A0ABZ1C2R1_9BACT|nr:ABC-type transport auxiliary lipoprotein family protein [Opitutus sp. WL0086]WRQ85642.1 ABC-type transport auxiliary lipoprotein family protein [Opitutus sp. WL0086]